MRVILFQDRFAGKVRDGSKCQTIRKTARCKPGDVLSLRRWTGKPYRSKQEVLREAVCTGVLPVEIRGELGIEWIRVNRVYVDGARFSRADGFACSTELLDWFSLTHGLPFEGEVIMWSNGAVSGAADPHTLDGPVGDIERAYCMICRREIMTESGHVCPSCANAPVSGTPSAQVAGSVSDSEGGRE